MIILEEIKQVTREFNLYECLPADQMVFRLNWPLWNSMATAHYNAQLQIMDDIINDPKHMQATTAYHVLALLSTGIR